MNPEFLADVRFGDSSELSGGSLAHTAAGSAAVHTRVADVRQLCSLGWLNS